MNTNQLQLPPLSDIENSDEFKALNLDDQTAVLNGYFNTREQEANSEDDYNNLLKERADRERSAFQLAYKAKNPDATSIDEAFVNADPELKKKYHSIESMYGELDYNVNKSLDSAKSFRADNMEDSTRNFSYKPFFRRGQLGYTVAYPNGETESIPNIESEAALRSYLRDNRADKFNGRRQDFIDRINPLADNEMEMIFDKMANTKGGVEGMVGAGRKTISNILQGYEGYNIKTINEGLNRYREAASTIQQLDPIIARLKKQKDQFPGRFARQQELSQLEAEREAASDAIYNTKTGIAGTPLTEKLNPLSEGMSISPDEAKEQLTEAYKSLADEYLAGEKIPGARINQEVDDFIAYDAGRNGDKEASWASYFGRNPSQIPAYIMATAAGALPDMIQMIGSSAAGAALAGSAGAAAGPAAVGFAREYTASLLSEIQARAAAEGKNLTDRETIESYFNDPAFMEKIQSKATKRAGAISGADAVFGALTHSIGQNMKNAFAKVASQTALGASTETLGEGLAQLTAEDKFSLRETIEEGLGGLGAGVVSAVTVPFEGRAEKRNLDRAKEQAAAKLAWDTRFGPESGTREYELSSDYQRQVTDRKPVSSNDIQNQDRVLPSLPEEAFESQAEQAEAETDSPLTEDLTENETIPDEQTGRTPITDLGRSVADSGRNMLQKALSFFDRNKTQEDQAEEAQLNYNVPTLEEHRNQEAQRLLNIPLYRSMYDILQEQSGESFNRIMEQLRNSEPDDRTVGRLMDTLKMKPSDANKRVLTNVLGNYWGKDGVTNEPTEHEKRGALLSIALDAKIREMMNVDSIYDLPLTELDSISKNKDIMIDLAQDGINNDGWAMQSWNYSEMDPDETVARYKASKKAKQGSRFPINEKLSDKFTESKLLDRPGINPVEFSSFEGKTPAQVAYQLADQYQGRYVIKSKKGFGGSDIVWSINLEGNSRDTSNMISDIKEIMDNPERMKDAYVEKMVDIPKKVDPESRKGSTDFDEYRVHVYVDNNGKAHAFRNLTFHKERSLYKQMRDYKEGNQKEDTQFIVPESPNDPLVAQFQKEAEKAMSKKQFKNNIFGLDMALVEQDGKIQPFIFEANPSDQGMSGFLGNAISQNEMLSELAGKPSVLAGLYQIAKLGMSREELNAISSSITERIEHEFKDSPQGYQVINNGMDIYNPFIGKETWMQAMQRRFRNAPREFLNQLWEAIKSVFSKTVDRVFRRQVENPSESEDIDTGAETETDTQEEGQEEVPLTEDQELGEEPVAANPKADSSSQSSPSSIPAMDTSDVSSLPEEAAQLNVQPKKSANIRRYIKGLLANPALPESHKQTLNYILKNANETFLEGVKVRPGKNSEYRMDKASIYISPEADAADAVHEVIHGVTSDFTIYNSQLLQTLFGYEMGEQNNTTELLSLLEAIKPDNKEWLLENGISQDYLDLAKVYINLLDNLGINADYVSVNGESPVGSYQDAYDFQEANPDTIPYGAINMDEMMAEALTNPEFQKQLSKMDAILGSSKNLFDEIIRIIAGILGIPVNKDNLLFDVAKTTLKAIGSPDNYYFVDLTAARTLNSERVKPSKIGNIDGTPFKQNETSQQTKNAAAREDTPAKLETIRKQAELEKQEARFNALKKSYRTILKGMKFDGTNLREAREKVVEALYEKMQSNPKTAREEKLTPAKKLAAATLIENKKLAVQYLETFKNDPTIPPEHVNMIVKAFDYVMKESADPLNMTTNQIKYYNNVLLSFSDGGPPVGFRHILVDQFIQDQMNKLAFASQGPSVNGKLGQLAQGFFNALKRKKNRDKPYSPFGRPIGAWRGEPLLGRLLGDVGSTASFASEINFIGTTEQAREFLAKYMGIYKDQIDAYELETQTMSSAFYTYLESQFPKGIRPINRTRIGLVGRLTQYNKAKPNWLDQLTSRYNQVVRSVPTMAVFDEDRAGLTTKALNDIVGVQDMTAFPDADSFIQYLESKLTPSELNVLNQLRDVGKFYLPSLQSVKVMTRNAAMDEYVNYIHDSNISIKEPGEGNMLQQFNSLSDILQDREGINPDLSAIYPDLDILNIAERQIKASNYEKHTGVQRYLLKRSLEPSSPIPAILDAATDVSNPITERLKKIVGSYHNSQTRSQPTVGPFIGFVEALMGIVQSHLITGAGALIKNFSSSAIQRMGLASLSNNALKNAFAFEANQRQATEWIKKNFPTQFNRTSEYDTLTARAGKSNLKRKWQTSMDLNKGIMTAMFKTLPYLPREALDKYQSIVTDTLGKFSNSIPERQNAFAMFVAAYIEYAQKNGNTSINGNNFMAFPVDRNAGTQASDFVSRSLGYAPDKAAKGSFWNGSTATKQFLSKTFFVFRQQAIGIAIEFQNEVVKASRNLQAGNLDEARKSMIMAGTLLANSMIFRGMSLALGSMMVWGGLDRYFNADDDEEKKRQLLKAKEKYARNSLRNNIRDFATETLVTVVPTVTSAFFVEQAAAWGLDVNKLILEPNTKEGQEGMFEANRKEDLRTEVENIDAQIKIRNEVIAEKEKRGMSTIPDEDELDKLEAEKDLLTEQIKFRYFPNKPLKAMAAAFGAYGIATEELTDRIETFINDDLEDKDKIALRNMLDNEFAYRDPAAGSTFPWDMINHAGKFVQSFYEFEKRPEDRVPPELFWKSMLKIGQNPAVTVERGRNEMAKQALQKEKEMQRKVDRLRARYLGRP